MREFDRIIAEYDLKREGRKRPHADYMFVEDPPKKLRALNDIKVNSKVHPHSKICLSKNQNVTMEF